MDRMVGYKQKGFMLCKEWLAISKKGFNVMLTMVGYKQKGFMLCKEWLAISKKV